MNRNEIPLSPHVTFLPGRSGLAVKGKEDIHLTPNERRLLELIISGEGKKETIIEEIWQSRGTIVGESSYHQLIKMLRRKLQCAGLPYSVIKTIPRYGIILTPFEPEALPEPNEQTTVCNKTDTEGQNLALNVTTSSVQNSGSSTVTLSKEHDKTLKGSFVPSDKKLFLFCGLLFIFPLLLIYMLLTQPQSEAFPYQLKIKDVTFHLTSLRNIDREAIAKHQQELSSTYKDVYIASNGPKVWIAECNGELSKDKKCRYEHYSSY